MKNSYFLFSTSPSFRALIVIIFSIGLFWPTIFLSHTLTYQGAPPLDLFIPFILGVICLFIKINLSKTQASLSLLGFKIYKLEALFVTTRQEGKLHRVFYQASEGSPLKPTLFLLNVIPVQLMEFLND